MNTQSTAVTFTDVTPGEQLVYRVQATRAEGRNQRSDYVNVTRRTGDGSRQRERPRSGAGGPFETKTTRGEEASMERFSPNLAFRRPVPTGTNSGSTPTTSRSGSSGSRKRRACRGLSPAATWRPIATPYGVGLKAGSGPTVSTGRR